MSAAESVTAKSTGAGAEAVELTAEGLQWMLLRAGQALFAGETPELDRVAARGVACDVWLNAYDAAPEAVRQSLTHSVMDSVAWAPAIEAALTPVLTHLDYVLTDNDTGTPLAAFVSAAIAAQSEAAVAPLFRVLQRVGLFDGASRMALRHALQRSALDAPRAYELLIADPNTDAALPGPTRCSAGDAHNPSRHHSARSADERVTVHDVLYRAATNPAVWRAFSDARLPFGARAMAEEWAYALTGPCGCAGSQRIAHNPLHRAIEDHSDEAGEWLAARLPPKRLNQRNRNGADTPLLAALWAVEPMPRTVEALLLRVPDVTLRVKSYDSGSKEYCTAAELIASHPPQWLSPHLGAELKLKTEQFGAQYLPSAAVLCAEALSGGVSVPRELVSLVLQYTALPQPNPWPNAHAAAYAAANSAVDSSASVTVVLAVPAAAAAAAAGAGAAAIDASHRPAEQRFSGRKRPRHGAVTAAPDPTARAVDESAPARSPAPATSAAAVETGNARRRSERLRQKRA